MPEGTSQAAEDDANQRELAMRRLLDKAGTLNGTGQLEEARALLADILAEAANLAPLFDGNADVADHQLRLAFKQGTSDFVGVRPEGVGALDFYPEWTPSE